MFTKILFMILFTADFIGIFPENKELVKLVKIIEYCLFIIIVSGRGFF